MNARAAKRLRIVGRILSKPETFRRVVKRLKRAYCALPYHRRTAEHGRPANLGHSAELRLFHDRSGHRR
jgi:hypothetical protein